MLTDSPIRSEWNRSLTDSSVDNPAIPIDPPILRIMLKRAEAAPLSRPFVMPDVVTADRGTMMRGWPSARMISGR